MSFSPEIDSSYILLANIYGNPNIDNSPYRSYYRFLQVNGLDDPNIGPVKFPTLYAFGDGSEAFDLNLLGDMDSDYMKNQIVAFPVSLPALDTGEKEQSGFLPWDGGYGATIFAGIWGYRHGAPGENDVYVAPVNVGIDGAANFLTQRNSINTDGEQALYYFKYNYNGSPFNTYLFSANFAAAVTSGHVGTSPTSFFNTRVQTQVLYSTVVAPLRHNAYVMKDDSGYVFPTDSSSTTDQNRHLSPTATLPYPVDDMSATDLTLYEATIIHYYDSGYDYVRQDIKERFKTKTQIENLRDEYVMAITEGIRELLSVTSEAPRGATTRRQTSPRALRENYTTFAQLSVDPNSESPTPGSTSVATTSTTGGSY